jgi:cysteine desulfurase family protein (TIGR01976 family)
MTSIVSETAMSDVASVDEIRSHFPALERMHAGRPVAYFDGPGGTQVPRQVVDLMADYLFNHNANTHWLYPTSAETDQAIDEARRTLCEFLGATTPEEIVFGPNMTTLAFHLGRALGRGWSAGDEIVVTELDHHANIAPWRALERERGLTVRSVPFRLEDGILDLGAIAEAIGPRTRLVAVGAASNAIGTVNDVTRICALARDAGALSFVDAVHYAPHELVDAQAMGCDFLACSAYKFYGPHIGILYGRLDLLERIDVPKLEPAPDTSPERLELGTQNHEGIVGAAAAVNFLASLSGTNGARRERLARTYQVLRERGDQLIARLWRGLESIDGLRLYGSQPGQPRTPTLSFTLKSLTSGSIASALADRALFASNGDFYAATVIERYGAVQDGFLRVGCSCYTTEEEVERLLEAVSEL